MRKLTDHIVPGDSVNHQLTVQVVDEPGQGGANHNYEVIRTSDTGVSIYTHIHFQEGPIKEMGVNGLTNEALLAIVIDRLRGFQSGPFKCRDNACALTHIEEALMWLQKRTRDRMARGVEGTNQQ